MKSSLRIETNRWLIVVLTLFAGSISEDALKAQEPPRANEAEGQSISKSIFTGYRSWKPINAEPIAVPERAFTACEPPDPPNGPNRRPSPTDKRGPHVGGFINIYVNPVGRDKYRGGKATSFDEGTVIVKEKLRGIKDEKSIELGVMIKKAKGSSPKTGDWQFAFVEQDGTILESQADVASCAKCHRIQEKNDYVFRRLALPSK